MGETCGLKMINTTIPIEGNCRICQAIAAKKRKFMKAKDDYERFRADPKRQATAAVRMEEMVNLKKEIDDLEGDRLARMNRVGNNRRNDRYSEHLPN